MTCGDGAGCGTSITGFGDPAVATTPLTARASAPTRILGRVNISFSKRCWPIASRAYAVEVSVIASSDLTIIRITTSGMVS